MPTLYFIAGESRFLTAQVVVCDWLRERLRDDHVKLIGLDALGNDPGGSHRTVNLKGIIKTRTSKKCKISFYVYNPVTKKRTNIFDPPVTIDHNKGLLYVWEAKAPTGSTCELIITTPGTTKRVTATIPNDNWGQRWRELKRRLPPQYKLLEALFLGAVYGGLLALLTAFFAGIWGVWE